MHRRRAVDEEVVDDGVVSAASNEGPFGHATENVALDPGRGEMVVEIDAHAALPLEAGDVVKTLWRIRLPRQVQSLPQ